MLTKEFMQVLLLSVKPVAQVLSNMVSTSSRERNDVLCMIFIQKKKDANAMSLQ